jgi:hypothetical protein
MPETVILGPPSLLARCAPASDGDLTVTRIPGETTAATIAATGADAVVAFDPSAGDRAAVAAAGLPTLLWWSDATAPAGADQAAWTGGPCRTIAAHATVPRGSWRSLPLPVADDLFSDLEATTAAVAVNFSDDDGPAHEHRALVALARGQLLISEPLAPSRGLEPGIDHLEARVPEDVRLLVENATRAPEAFERVRLRGRRKAELFRSSAVVGRLVGDLLLELRPRHAT